MAAYRFLFAPVLLVVAVLGRSGERTRPAPPPPVVQAVQAPQPTSPGGKVAPPDVQEGDRADRSPPRPAR